MKGVLDILHEWKNVLNKSFEQKREYRFITRVADILINKSESGTVTLQYIDIDGNVRVRVIEDTELWVWDVKVGTEAIVKWDEEVTFLVVNYERIV